MQCLHARARSSLTAAVAPSCAGHPSIFWDHYFESGHKDCIDQLVALRKRAGISGGSGIEILCADADMYVARINDKCAPFSALNAAVSLRPPSGRCVVRDAAASRSHPRTPCTSPGRVQLHALALCSQAIRAAHNRACVCWRVTLPMRGCPARAA